MDSFILKSTGDQRDRKEDIETLLKEYGVCILANGTFYVSGVEMPNGSTLQGVGECSEIVLAEEITQGYAVKMGSCCRVQNLTLRGAGAEISREMELGNRHGVGFVGNATKENRKEIQPRYGFV
ncbi:MAG: hypothetical protein IKD18_01030, partial [Clostridia bacterium]|nr:hypothetical protein [Clostridia bacterium]